MGKRSLRTWYDIQTYVYHYPETNVPFYVGHGTFKRPYCHLKPSVTGVCADVVRELRAKGLSPLIEVIPVSSKSEAEDLEAELVKKYGRISEGGTLVNICPGGSKSFNLKHLTSKMRGDHNRIKNSRQVTCPQCGKSGQQGGMKRWHFNNCRGY